MNFIEQVRSNAALLNKKIVLPESGDERVLKAAEILKREKIATPLLVGIPEEIARSAGALKVDLAGIEIINPHTDSDRQAYIDELVALRKHKGMTPEQAADILYNNLFYGAFLVRSGRADGGVAGSVSTTGDVLRAAIQVIRMAPGIKAVSSSFVMVLKDGRIFTYGDCAVIPDPDVEQLAGIALSTAQTHLRLTGQTPNVAMLSFSSKGSADHPHVDKVVQATKMAKEQQPALNIDGDLQFDTALLESVGKRKAADSPVAGKANVYIFPDLDAGNIGYKITQRLAGAEAIGPVIQGLAKPFNDLSRGCSTDDIVSVAAICSVLSN